MLLHLIISTMDVPHHWVLFQIPSLDIPTWKGGVRDWSVCTSLSHPKGKLTPHLPLLKGSEGFPELVLCLLLLSIPSQDKMQTLPVLQAPNPRGLLSFQVCSHGECIQVEEVFRSTNCSAKCPGHAVRHQH